MIINVCIAISIYILAIYLLLLRNEKWKKIPDKFVKYYKVTVPTIVYVLPLIFHLRNGTDLALIEFLPLFLGFGIWSLAPFLILVYLAGTRLENLALAFTTVVLLAVEIVANLKVHVFPGSSTDGIIFLFVPIFQTLFVIPACLLVCGVIQWLYSVANKMRRA